MRERVTMRDIAHRAGVSPATVSNVLNNRRSQISDRTAQKVLLVAQELGYQPLVNRRTANRRNETIGLILPSVFSSVYSVFAAAVEAVAARLGFGIQLASSYEDEKQEPVVVRNLLRRNIEGLIVVSNSEFRETAVLNPIVDAGLPTVVVNRITIPEVALHLVVDNEQATYQATEHLINLGHQHIGCIHFPVSGPGTKIAAVQRLKGYERALEAYGLVRNTEWIRPGAPRDTVEAAAMGYAAAHTILSTSKVPTAIVCGSDPLAIGAMRAAASQGLSIPDDLAVVGHDDTPAAPFITPPLTSVRQPMETAGARAAEAVIHALMKGVSLEGVEKLPSQLVIRASSHPINQGYYPNGSPTAPALSPSFR